MSKKISFFKLLIFCFILFNYLNLICAVERTVDLENYRVEYTYSKVNLGEEFNLKVKITNEENSKNEKIVFKIEDNSEFKVLTEKTWEIGSMNYKESITNNIKIQASKKTNLEVENLQFIIKDTKREYSGEFRININLNDANLIIKNISSEPKKIISDQDSIRIVINLENTGEEKAEQISAKLILPEGFSRKNSYSDVFSISEIKPRNSKEAIFFIASEENLIPKNYPGTLLLDYEVNRKKQTSSLAIDFPLDSSPKFNIIYVTPSKFYLGKENTLKILLQNTGNKKGEATSIRIIEKPNDFFEVENNKVELGTISPFETGTATFSLSTKKETKVGQYSIELEIKTLLDGEEITYYKTVSVAVVEKEGEFFISLVLFLTLSILITGYVLLKKYLLRKQ